MSLRRAIEDATGLALTQASVERAVRELYPQLDAAARAAHAPAPGSAQFDALLDALVVPESWMFRDPAVFDEALRFVRARLASRPDAPLRILSLPCAGGEEPYSMAMALLDAGITPQQCRIDAFDLSHAAIARAAAGRYTRNAFRGADLAFRQRHFSQQGEDWIVHADVRAYVHLARANLFALDGAALAGRYDLVFCRNLLIYFDEPATRRAAALLSTLLADDGLLLAGYAETPALCRHGFAMQALRHACILRKADAAPPVRPARPLRRPAPVPPIAPMAAQPAPALPAPRPHVAPQEQLAQARSHADAGRLAQAEALCRTLLARLPELADAWFLLGTIDEAAGRARAAARCWQRCVYLDPQHYEALCSLALLHEQLGDGARGAGFRRRAALVFARRGGTP